MDQDDGEKNWESNEPPKQSSYKQSNKENFKYNNEEKKENNHSWWLINLFTCYSLCVFLNFKFSFLFFLNATLIVVLNTATTKFANGGIKVGGSRGDVNLGLADQGPIRYGRPGFLNDTFLTRKIIQMLKLSQTIFWEDMEIWVLNLALNKNKSTRKNWENYELSLRLFSEGKKVLMKVMLKN